MEILYVNGVQELTSACKRITSKAFKNQEAPSCKDKCYTILLDLESSLTIFDLADLSLFM